MDTPSLIFLRSPEGFARVAHGLRAALARDAFAATSEQLGGFIETLQDVEHSASEAAKFNKAQAAQTQQTDPAPVTEPVPLSVFPVVPVMPQAPAGSGA